MDREIVFKNKIKELFKSGEDISIPIIQRKYLIGFHLATKVFEGLKKDGFVIISKNYPLGISKVK